MIDGTISHYQILEKPGEAVWATPEAVVAQVGSKSLPITPAVVTHRTEMSRQCGSA